MTMRGRVRMRGPWPDAFTLGDAAVAVAVERHYLQFDGIVDYAVADAVFGGISADYSIAIKVATLNTSGSAGRAYYAAGGPAGIQTRHDRAYQYYLDGTTRIDGYITSNLYNISFAGPGDSNRRIFAVKRDYSAGDAFARVVKAGAVEASGSDTTAAVTIPDHLAVGTILDDSLTPLAGYGNVAFIGLVLTSSLVSDAELIAWIDGTDAEEAISNIDHYWVASDISGSSIPARVGSVALTLNGPTDADLVEWSGP